VRVLILGGTGMLGHKLWQSFRHRFETWAAVRSHHTRYDRFQLFENERLLVGVDANDMDSIVRVLTVVHPDVVINCIGIIKQLSSSQDPIISLTINSLFPHRLARLCQAIGARCIHISTDCVFSGHKGQYIETDVSDAEDLYGRSKYLGEVSGENCLTLRTSIIGRELETQSGLVEWFLGNQGKSVRGYTNAIYSGFTTLALAGIIAHVIEEHPDLSGLYHVSAKPITKHDLLVLIRDTYGLSIEIEPYADIWIDRSLDSERFWTAVKSSPPSWVEMIRDMYEDSTPYDQWRQHNAS